MEPDHADLKKHAGLLKDIGLKARESDVDIVGKALGLWIDLSAVSSNLIAANGKLANVCVAGDDSMKNFFQQDGLDKLVAVKALRHKLCATIGKLAELKPAIGDPSGPLDALLSMEIPHAIQTELERETIDDLCCFGMGESFDVMTELVNQFKTEILECRKAKDPDNMEDFKDNQLEYFLQWSSGNPLDWHQGIPADATCHNLLGKMQKTIYFIPAQSTQTFCKSAWEAGWTKLDSTLDSNQNQIKSKH